MSDEDKLNGKDPPGSGEPYSVPPGLRYAMLSALWFFPSVGAVVILITTPGQERQEGQGFREWAASIPIERWVAVGIVCSHLIFIALAVYYWRKEKARGGQGA